jgi:hypothetical protein
MKKANQSQTDTDIEKRRYETTLERPPRQDLRRDHAPIRDPDLKKEKIQKRDDMGGTSVYKKKNEKQKEKTSNDSPSSTGRSMEGWEPKKENLEQLLKVEAKLDVCIKFLSQALSDFASLKSIDISPDGKLGGRGFVMDISEIRSRMYSTVENISLVIDTLYDETRGKHWTGKFEVAEMKEEAKEEAKDDHLENSDIDKVSSVYEFVKKASK